jgi:NAD(P)-dependent dehydrogenase (short-subunit alcohol dehydrogenase family)
MLTEFEGRTAVITGGASGMGLGTARRCAERGMNVVLLDIEADALAGAVELIDAGDRVLPVVTDVADADQVQAAADATAERFGPVHLLFNNAGVSLTSRAWNTSVDDCTWMIGVNLIGVFNGIRSFVPGMMKHGQDAHVVSTASMAGLVPMSNASLYSATKAGVVALSECMLYEFGERGARIGVSVLCPGLVNTNIYRSERNRPASLSDTRAQPASEAVAEFYRTSGSDPLEVGERVLRAVERGDFYILTQDEGRVDIAARGSVLDALGVPAPPRPEAIRPDDAPEGAFGFPI